VAAPIAGAPIVRPRGVRGTGIAIVVIWSPPAPAVGAAYPTHLLRICRNICCNWCNWHCGNGGGCKGAAKDSARKNQLEFAHEHSSVGAPLMSTLRKFLTALRQFT